MNEKTVNINNFIGTYDNYITKNECDRAIKLYEDQNKFNNTINKSKKHNEKNKMMYNKNYITNINILL